MRLRNIPEAKAIVAESPWVIHEPEKLRGSWADGKKLGVEIGMGKGRFIMETARRHPEMAFLGIERYESVLFRACNAMSGVPCLHPGQTEVSAAESLLPAPENLHFLCMDAGRLSEVFAPGEIAELYLNFSDPWPKARHAKRRLTYRGFLALYAAVMKEGGRLIFKTDNRPLFDFSLEEFEASPQFSLVSVCDDLHHDEALMRENVMTEYEAKFSALGNKICRLEAVCVGAGH